MGVLGHDQKSLEMVPLKAMTRLPRPCLPPSTIGISVQTTVGLCHPPGSQGDVPDSKYRGVSGEGVRWTELEATSCGQWGTFSRLERTQSPPPAHRDEIGRPQPLTMDRPSDARGWEECGESMGAYALVLPLRKLNVGLNRVSLKGTEH